MLDTLLRQHFTTIRKQTLYFIEGVDEEAFACLYSPPSSEALRDTQERGLGSFYALANLGVYTELTNPGQAWK